MDRRVVARHLVCRSIVMPFHTRIRLSKEIYTIPYQPCSITIGTAHRQSCFTNDPFTTACIQCLRSYSTKHRIKFYAFCFMPDHIHLLSEATRVKSLITIIQELKGLWTKIGWEHGFQGTVFQKSFFDHFLRKDEDVRTVVHYILNNPVRAGLVKRWEEYPYLGSTVYTREELSGG